MFHIGQHVTVDKYGGKYQGTVTKVGRTRVFVKFFTKSGHVKIQPFPMEGYGSPRGGSR